MARIEDAMKRVAGSMHEIDIAFHKEGSSADEDDKEPQ